MNKHLLPSLIVAALLAVGIAAQADMLPLSQQQAQGLYINSAGVDTSTGSVGTSNPGGGLVAKDSAGVDWVLQPKDDGTSRWSKKDHMPLIMMPLMDNLDYYDQGGRKGTATFTRTSSAWYRNTTGAWTAAPANTPRFGFENVSTTAGWKWQKQGYLSENPATNYALYSQGPSTQTVYLAAASYTLWVEGAGSCAVASSPMSGALGSGWGTATASSPVYLTVTSQGNVDLTVSGSLSFIQLENSVRQTSAIVTNGTPVTRAQDLLYLPATGLMNDAEGTVSMKYRPYVGGPLTSSPYWLHMFGSEVSPYAYVFARSLSQNFLYSQDGTNGMTLSVTWTRKQYRLACTWSGSTRKLYNSTDGTSASGTFDGNWNFTSNIYVGKATAAAAGYVQDVRIFDKALTDSEVGAL